MDILNIKNLSLCSCLAFIFYIVFIIAIVAANWRSWNPNILLSHSFIMKCQKKGFLTLDLNIIMCAVISRLEAAAEDFVMHMD